MKTVVGIFSDADGISRNREVRPSVWATPGDQVRTEQAPFIGIDRSHDGRWVGQILYLERNDGKLWAVGLVDREPHVLVRVADETVALTAPVFWSAEWDAAPGPSDILIRSIALTHQPAKVAARPVTFYPGGLGSRRQWTTPAFERGLLNRAFDAHISRHGRPLVIHGERPAAGDGDFMRSAALLPKRPGLQGPPYWMR